MKRWTLGGLSVLIIGFVAFSFRGGCQVELTIEDQVTPPEARMGWNEEAAHSDETQQLVAQMPAFEIDGVWKDNTKANVRYWEIADQVGVDYRRWLARQEVGDCVSWGAAKAGNWLQCLQIALGQEAEFHELYPPYIYGTSRVQIGQGRLSGDGSVGAWAAKAVQQYGVLRLDAEGVPRYSGQIAREWGRRGPPQQFIEIAKRNPIRTVSQVRSAQEACDAICNGYPITIASNAGFGSISERDGRMVGRWTTSWAHQMHLCGYDGTAPSGERYFYCLNSWGPSAHPSPLQGEPPGGFWISWSDVDRICRQGDSFAFSSFVGFPAQDLDFTIFEQQANVGLFNIQREVVMLSWMIVGCAGVLVVCVFLTRQRSRGLALLCLCAVPTAAIGQEPDFSMFAPPSKAIQCTDGICFDVFGTQVPCPEDLNFAMLAPVCRCKDGLDCTCPKGECQCKDHGDEADNRPLLTVKTQKDCGPCERLKKDSETDALNAFRFEFIEQNQVEGGAPRIEWQGADAKWAINGYRGPDSLKQLYQLSQTKRQSPSAYISSSMPVLGWQSPSRCFGGACRTCR